MSRDLLAPPTHRGSLATRPGLASTYIMSTGAGLGWADLLHFAKRQKTKLKGRNKDKDGSEEPNRTATVSVSVKMSTLCIA